jgi:hypothetical protein
VKHFPDKGLYEPTVLRTIFLEFENKDWEQELQDFDRFRSEQPRHLSAADRDRIGTLAADLPGLWHSPTTTGADRRAIVRLLIDRVVIHVEKSSDRVDVALHWTGGFTSQHELLRPVAGYDKMADYDRMVDRIEGLRRQRLTFAEIADHLNREGFQPSQRAEKFHADIVCRFFRKLRQQRQSAREIARQELLGENEWFALNLARLLGMPKNSLLHWIRRGWVRVIRQLPGIRGRKICWADAEEIDRLTRLRDISHNWWDPPLPAELTTPKLPSGA